MNYWTRRDVIKAAMVSGGAALWPWGRLQAQSNTLIRAPKQALIIGNDKYRRSPLKNPVNDALDLAGVLKEMGFVVTLELNLTQEGMRDAIRAYSESIGRTKAVGLFYFAGHGAQLAWRNYLIPVDADIVNVEELKERCVDLNTLIEGIGNARNPMNIIVLDACRDNPFGRKALLEHKGLSQVDAPPGTLLAYATAPGNTAIDGEGNNGLYTEHLLREIKIPEAKVEDVFKRVRLAVRRRSRGLQVPWESTSLEQDFWFIPPSVLKVAEDDVDRAFLEELALWESIRNANEPEPLENYLKRYPSGRFSELAQFRLEWILARQGEKAIQIPAQTANPFTKGTARTDVGYKIGDRYTYRVFDPVANTQPKEFTRVVTQVTESEVIFNNGGFVTDLLGNTIRNARGHFEGIRQFYVPEYSIGKKWTTRYKATVDRRDFTVEIDFRVVTREPITAPAGLFEAHKVEGFGFNSNGARLEYVYWLAPSLVRPFLVYQHVFRNKARNYFEALRMELTSYNQRA